MLGDRRRPARAAVCLVALLALAASACGSDDRQSSADLKISTLASSTIDVGTARIAGTIRSSDSSVTPNPYETTFTGELDFIHDRSSLTATTKAPKGDPQVSHSVRVDGYDYYDRTSWSEDDPRGAPSGKPWTRMEALPTRVGLGGGGVADVASMFDQLERWGGEAEEVGAEDVRGVPTTHYRFLFEPRAVPQQLIAMGKMAEPATATVEIWADAEHRMRRVVQSAEGASDSFRAEYFDFGAPVSIEAPPADQVEVEELWELTGDWEPAQRGRAGNVDWAIHRAPGADGTVCLAHEATPAGPFDDIGFPKRRGRTVDVCASTSSQPEPGVPGMAGVPGVFDGGFGPTASVLANGDALLFGPVDPGTTSVALHFADGHTERVIPQHDTLAVVLGADEVVDRIEPDLPGHEISCELYDDAADVDVDGHRVFGYSCTDEANQSPAGLMSPGGDLPVVPDSPNTRPDVG